EIFLRRRRGGDLPLLRLPPGIGGFPRRLLGFRDAELPATDRVPFPVEFLRPPPPGGNPGHVVLDGHGTPGCLTKCRASNLDDRPLICQTICQKMGSRRSVVKPCPEWRLAANAVIIGV